MIVRDDGKKGVCPLAIARAELTGLADTCVGSGCMAWRPVGDGKGYCGMAGAPASVMTELQTASVTALMDASEKSAAEARKRFEQMVGAASASGPGN